MAAFFDLTPAQWQRLRALLDEGLALTPAARPDWLENLRDDDALLRPRLAELLAQAEKDASQSTAGALDRGPTLLPPAGGIDGEAAPAGLQVGPYRLISELGRGGMGSVWLAERTDMLQGRRVALKLPHGAGLRPGLRERLAREREILATLEHPNIARLYDAGITASGQPFIALEWVDGLRIDHYAQQHALSVPQRIGLFLQVCDAVAHAHARLVVHRDLKPANILVDTSGRVKLLDFGIAKLLQDETPQADELTRENGTAMTPGYAAPEQLQGRPLGTAADIYVLGLVLYELLTHQRPEALPAATAHESETPRPSSAVTDKALQRALRGDLDTIVGKALRPDPAARYATVDALAADLRRHLAHEPVLARPDSRAYRLRRFVRRNFLGVAASAAFVLVIVAGTAAALWQAELAQRQRDLALRAQAEAARAAGLARRSQKLAEAQADYSEFLLSDAAKGLPLDASVAQLERSLEMVRRQYRQDDAMRGRMLVDVADRLRWVGQDPRAAELLAEAEPLLRASGEHDAVARILCLRAREQGRQSRFDEGRQTIAQAAEALARWGDPNSKYYAGCLLEEAALERMAGQTAKAIALTERAWEHEQRAGRGEAEFAAEILMSLSRARLDNANFAGAAAAARQGLGLRVAIGHDTGPGYWQGWSLLAMALRDGGQPRDALHAFGGEGRFDPAGAEQAPAIRMQYALSLSAQGRNEEALRLLQQMRDTVAKAGSASQQRSLATRTAVVQVAGGQLQAAGETLSALEPHFAKLRAERRAAARPYLMALAQWAVESRDAARATAITAELQQNLGASPSGPDQWRAWRRLSAQQALMQSRADEALAEADKALAISIRLAIDPQASLHIGEDLALRGQARRALGQREAALADALSALKHGTAAGGAEHPLAEQARQLKSAVEREAP